MRNMPPFLTLPFACMDLFFGECRARSDCTYVQFDLALRSTLLVTQTLRGTNSHARVINTYNYSKLQSKFHSVWSSLSENEYRSVTTCFVIKTRFVIIHYKTGWENIITIRVDSYNPFCNETPNCNKV